MYLLTELQQLAEVLEAQFGAPITEDALRESIAVYNEQRRLLSQLYEQRQCFSTEEVWALTLLSMLMPVAEHSALLRSLLSEKLRQARADERGPALLLVGAVFDDPSLLGLITELGGRVAGDDLCTGSRYFDTLVDEGVEPYSALAERYLSRPPCPAKHAGIDLRVERVLTLARATGADGVIFLSPKFCDPHAFDYVPLYQELDKVGVAHLLLEPEVTAPEGQLRTRLQAFFEMLERTPR
jgi:benzoyl-CoA reductase/2-hydroxyglutaryl-CoA dehydratase subunit BcrC/BadD/HgdB